MDPMTGSGVTLMQLRRRTRSRLGVPLSDAFFTDDILDDHINLALDVIDSEHNWPWNERHEQVDVGTDGVVALTTPPRRTMRSVFVQGIELRPISSSDLLRDFGSTPRTGVPSAWAELASEIVVRPVPGEVMKADVVYYVTSIPLAADADMLTMPDQYAGSVIAKAAELLSVREDNGSAAERHAAEYAQWLGRMRRALRRSTGPIQPRVREGGWV